MEGLSPEGHSRALPIKSTYSACAAMQALGLPHGMLLPPHRLDAGTEGVVVLAKSSAFARRLKELFDNKEQVRPAAEEGGPASYLPVCTPP